MKEHVPEIIAILLLILLIVFNGFDSMKRGVATAAFTISLYILIKNISKGSGGLIKNIVLTAVSSFLLSYLLINDMKTLVDEMITFYIGITIFDKIKDIFS